MNTQEMYTDTLYIVSNYVHNVKKYTFTQFSSYVQQVSKKKDISIVLIATHHTYLQYTVYI